MMGVFFEMDLKRFTFMSMEFLEKNIEPGRDGVGANQLFLLLNIRKSTPFTSNGFLLSKIRTSRGVYSLYLGIPQMPEEGELSSKLNLDDGYSVEDALNEIRENRLESEIVFRENAHIRIMNHEGSFLGIVFSDYEDALEYVEKYLEVGI